MTSPPARCPSIRFDQIKLRSITLGAHPTATVELPDGTRHVLKVGSMIGRSYGQVKTIRKGEVVVQEEKRDAQGMRHAYEVIMRPVVP
jgi:Tfp pilus assembly protein PilP